LRIAIAIGRKIINHEGVLTLCVNGKTYTREEFYKAQRLELRRGKSGRFVGKVVKI
jgi:hypothetical protein